MSSRNNSSNLKISLFALVGIVAILAGCFALTQCSKNDEPVESSSRATTSNYYDTEHNSEQPGYNNSNSTSVKLTSSENGSGGTGEFIDPTEPIETKGKKYDLEGIDKDIVYDLFERIFEYANRNFELKSNNENDKLFEEDLVILKRSLIVKCPVCNQTQLFSLIFRRKGIIEIQKVQGLDSHFNSNYTIDVAEIFAQYLSKENAVLVGRNYKNDFGIVQKNEFWYFEFLGLNIPLFKGGVDIFLDSILKASGDILIKAICEQPTRTSNYSEEELSNGLPLLFYRFFADVIVDYQIVDSAHAIVDKATEDARNKQFDQTILASNFGEINDAISTLELEDDVFFLGKVTGTDSDRIYSTSEISIYDDFFKENNPEFTNTETFYLDENGNFIIYVENGYEGASYIYTNVEMQYFGKRFFPFFNAFTDVTPEIFNGTHYGDNGGGHFTFASEIGKIACYASENNQWGIDYYIDKENDPVPDLSSYYYETSLTDAYYYILDYSLRNIYTYEAKMLYAKTYNDLTKPSELVYENPIVVHYIPEDPQEIAYTNIYGLVEIEKIRNNEVIKCGFEVTQNEKTIRYTTNYYTTIYYKNGQYYNADENHYFFTKTFNPIQDEFKVRFFIEYKDKIEYSQVITDKGAIIYE